MHTLHFDASTEQAISQLAAQAGKNTDDFLKDVVREYLEEQRDIHQADAAYTRYLAGEEKAVSLAELERRLGLES